MASQEEAREAIYTAVVDLANASTKYGGTTAGQMLRDAGIAFRAASGGAQVGGIFVDAK